MNHVVARILEIAKERKIPIGVLAAFVGCARITVYHWKAGAVPHPNWETKLEDLLYRLEHGASAEDLRAHSPE